MGRRLDEVLRAVAEASGPQYAAGGGSGDSVALVFDLGLLRSEILSLAAQRGLRLQPGPPLEGALDEAAAVLQVCKDCRGVAEALKAHAAKCIDAAVRAARASQQSLQWHEAQLAAAESAAAESGASQPGSPAGSPARALAARHAALRSEVQAEQRLAATEEELAESCEAAWRAELGGTEAREEAMLLQLQEDRAALLQEISTYEVKYSSVIERARAADEREEQLEQNAYEAR